MPPMKKAIIIDDELRARTTLTNFIKKYCPEIDLIGEAEGVKQGIKLIKDTQPDLVFLDVRMNDGSGFDLLDHIPEKNFQLIFTTAYEEYALKAFKYSAIDFLVKPIDPDELTTAVKKVISESQNKQMNGEKLATLSYNLHNRANPRLAISDTKGIMMVAVEDIIYCKSDNNYTTIALKNGQNIVASKLLKEFEDMLSGLNFFRIHNSFIVNLHHVVRYIKGEGGQVIMSDKSELEVSRRKKLEFLDSLAKL
jgi:two-component system, LytTR family, response regulator